MTYFLSRYQQISFTMMLAYCFLFSTSPMGNLSAQEMNQQQQSVMENQPIYQKILNSSTIKQNQLNALERKRQSYTQYQQKQYQQRAHASLSTLHQSPVPLPPAHPEEFGAINIESIDAHFYFSSFAFPTWTVQAISFVPAQDTFEINLLAYHFNVLGAKSLDTMEALRYRSQDGYLSVFFDVPLRANQRYTFEFEGMLVFECNNLDCYEGDDSVVYLDAYGLLLNPDFTQRDLFLLNLQFLSSDQNLSFAASGTSLEIVPCIEGICWKYESIYPNLLPAFVVLDSSVQVWRPNIDLYPPRFGSYQLIGRTADLVLDFYEQLYFPYPYQRLNIVNMTDNLGVALGPMANVMFPAGLWLESGDFNDLYTQFVLAHELAHQYFFNWVKLSELSEAWTSEGFAEYSAQRFMENLQGNDLFRRLDYWQYMYTVPRAEDTGVSTFEATLSPYYFLLVYHKAASVLQMIRQRVGDFDEIMKDYVNDFGLLFTSTAEFQAYLSEKTGLNWDQFFQRWLYQPSYPIFTASLSEGLGDSSDWQVQLTINSDEILGEGVLMNIGIPFVCERDGIEQRQSLFFNGLEEKIDINCDNGELDPTLSLLRRISSQAGVDVDFSGVVDGVDFMKIYESLEQGAYFGHPSWNDVRDLNGDLYIDLNDLFKVYQSLGQGLRE